MIGDTMFCPSCGAEVQGNAKYCGHCGAELRIEEELPDAAVPPADETDATEDVLPVAENTLSAAGVPADEADATTEAKDPKGKRRTIIIVIVCLVLALAVVGGLLYRQHMQKVAYEQAHSSHAVTFSVQAPGYDTTKGSKIPLKVVGNDLDGNAVDQQAYIGVDGSGLELARGNYTVSVVASPFPGDGSLYAVPTSTWTVSIGEDIEPGAAYEGVAGTPIVFEKIAALDVTDAQIDASYQAALVSGMQQASADSLKQAVANAYQSAVEEKAAAEAAAAEEAEKASLRAQTSGLPTYTGTVKIGTFAELAKDAGRNTLSDSDYREIAAVLVFNEAQSVTGKWGSTGEMKTMTVDRLAPAGSDKYIDKYRKYEGQTITVAGNVGWDSSYNPIGQGFIEDPVVIDW